jgi:hypothetical protein
MAAVSWKIQIPAGGTVYLLAIHPPGADPLESIRQSCPTAAEKGRRTDRPCSWHPWKQGGPGPIGNLVPGLVVRFGPSNP